MIFQCHVCDKVYPKKGNLNRHLLEVHGLQIEQKKLFVCALCNERSTSEKCLFEHLRSAHEVEVKCEILHFSTADEFQKWKEETEQTTLSKFVKRRGSHAKVDSEVVSYICHRSGSAVKKQPTIKNTEGVAGPFPITACALQHSPTNRSTPMIQPIAKQAEVVSSPSLATSYVLKHSPRNSSTSTIQPIPKQAVVVPHPSIGTVRVLLHSSTNGAVLPHINQ
ncbi:uncharacterized protein LOC126483909 isoform X2 [Schistocerca serialis cubense]|uniref:uncharacterized protein LOC126483909 isoform X2 n=1 Tax=Schistocerca serialis cubense TaxID=2023355 RepID=UPI00214E408D|nr:uncharacterized protein LOC126483909 isoform X2 [Schistocerca serialis cubense]